MLLMLRVLKVAQYTVDYKGCNALYVKGVESNSIYTIRAVMPCMSKVLKEAQNGLEHFCS